MTTNPKIAFWLPNFAATGLQTSTIRVAQALAQQGLSVDLVVSHNKGPLLSLVKGPVRIVDLNLSSGRLGRGLIRAVRYVVRERPYAVCACSGSGYLLAAFVRLLRGSTQIWIWELSTSEYRHLARAIERQRKSLLVRTWRAIIRGIYHIAQRVFITAVDGVIANSRAVAEEVARASFLHEDRIHVIYNACISGSIPDKAAEEREMQNSRKDSCVILSVGRLSERKDLDVLLRAFRVVRDQRPVCLRIVGEGPCRRKLERLIDELKLSDDTELAGFKPDPFACLDRADLFVLSSRAEPFGNVLVEAMACGLPVVSTDSTGPREILEWGRYGPLVPVGDHIALAAAMAQVLENPPHPDVLRMRAMEFHSDRIASQYRRVLGV